MMYTHFAPPDRRRPEVEMSTAARNHVARGSQSKAGVKEELWKVFVQLSSEEMS